MELTLRPETMADRRAVEELTRAAFWNHYAPGCVEHYLAHILRDIAAFVHELDFVAVHDGQIVGNIMYTRAAVHGDSGEVRPVLCFGPLSVLPEFQGRGVGTRLIQHTKALARDLGHTAILIYGDPAFYKRVGFIPAEDFSIGTAQNTYAAALLACELVPGALAHCPGRFVEDEAFNFAPDRAAEFDRTFPQRERVSGLLSQQRFAQLSAMIRPRD